MNLEKSKFLWSFHYFRAFAILNIILIHTWRLPKNSSYVYGINLVDNTRDMLFHGSTIYFLFISGFLFHYLSYRFTIRSYYLGKFKNVVVPYIIISVFLIFAEDFTGSKANIPLLNYLYIIPEKLIKGTASFQFWYIPFIIIVFLISPIFLKIKSKTFTKYIPLLFLLPILGTRTTVYITFWQFAYFLPPYLLGIYTSMNFDFVMNLVKKYISVLCLVAIITSIFLLFVEKYAVYYNLLSPRESLVYLQKVSITFIILHLSREINENRYPFLNTIANCSFALYFTHVIFDRHLKKIYYLVDSYTNNFFKIPLSLFYVLVLVLVSVLFCIIVKRILGKNSRFFIGY